MSIIKGKELLNEAKFLKLSVEEIVQKFKKL